MPEHIQDASGRNLAVNDENRREATSQISARSATKCLVGTRPEAIRQLLGPMVVSFQETRQAQPGQGRTS